MNNLRGVFFIVQKHRNNLWLFPIAIGALVALFAPLDVLKFSVALWLVNSMAVVVPMIGNIKADYELSQVAQVYFAVMWMLAPVIYYSINVGDREKVLEKLRANHSLFWITLIIFIPIVVVGGYFYYYVGPSPYETVGHDFVILHSRVGMASYGSLVLMGFVALPKFLLQIVNCYFDMYSQGEQK